MKKKLTDEQINEIVQILDNAIHDGPWDASNFLKAIGNKLRDVRAEFVEHVQTSGKQLLEKMLEDNAEKLLLQRANQQEIFITLYSSEGSNLNSWERILSNLPRQVISRPIYSKEEDALYMIRSKASRTNEAYVGVYIHATDILPLPPDKTLTDKFGKPLLSLKDKAISVENISRFIHSSGNYHYIKGRLVRQ